MLQEEDEDDDEEHGDLDDEDDEPENDLEGHGHEDVPEGPEGHEDNPAGPAPAIPEAGESVSVKLDEDSKKENMSASSETSGAEQSSASVPGPYAFHGLYVLL